MRIRISVIVISIILGCGLAYGQAGSTPPFSLRASPQLTLPLGGDSDFFRLGYGASLSAEYRMPFLPILYAGAGAEYSYIPIVNTTQMSLINLGLIAGVKMNIASIFGFRVYGAAGGYYSQVHRFPLSDFGLMASGGLGLTFALGPRMVLDAGAAYRMYFGLYNDLAINAGFSYALGGGTPAPKPPVEKPQTQTPAPQPLKQTTPPPAPAPKPAVTKGAGLDLAAPQALSVFPILFKFYNDNPIGVAELRNKDTSPAENIRVTFLVKQYMDNPKECKAPASLKSGETGSVDLYGLFTNSILTISEATLVSANLTIEYTMGGKPQKKDMTLAIRIQDRNAMSWDQTAKAAAFITSKDPSILKFSKNVSSAIKGKATAALNANILSAIGIHQALDLYGLSYVVDPVTPHAAASKDPTMVDFLQFPRQTLDYKAGDCDDLTILYCALLESVGVETAFITVPGHIYAAFSLGSTADEARKLFTHYDDLILIDGTAWMPVEVTERKGGFVSAWQSGAKTWRENKTKGQAELLPVHAAWTKFESVGISADPLAMTLPAEDQLVGSYTREVLKLIDNEISAQVNTLLDREKKAQDPSKPANELGVLYARYGLYDRAETEFQKAVKKEYAPALVNMGNLLYLDKDYRGAIGYYERAQKKDPANSMAILGIARANHAMENYGDAKAAYAALTKADPAMAQRFAYLDLRGEEAARAAAVNQASTAMEWNE